jgi:hypothetical protein
LEYVSSMLELNVSEEETIPMSQQDGTQTTLKRLRSRKTSKPTLRRPTNDDKEPWKAYWVE